MRDVVDDEFAGYVASRQQVLLKSVYLLCGDADTALALVRRALARLARRWHRLRDADPDVVLNRILYRDTASVRRRVVRALRGTGSGPEVEELLRLPSRVRTILVLRNLEELSVEETAEVLGIPPGDVRTEPDWPRERLLAAASGVVAPDLADLTWSDALGTVRRRGRRALATTGGVGVLALVAVVAQLGGAGPGPPEELVGPSMPPSVEPVVPPAGTLAGLPYWIAPPAGSEPYLDRVDTALGDTLAIPDGTLGDLAKRPVNRVAAVMLRKVPGADRYRPVLLNTRGRWVESALELVPIGDRALPLDASAVSRDGVRVAFAQPGEVVVLDASTAVIERIPVPSATISQVSWLPSGDGLLVSGPDAAYTIALDDAVEEEEPVVRAVAPGSEPDAATAPYALDLTDGTAVLDRYDVDGARREDQRLALPVAHWSGETYTSGRLAARVFSTDQDPGGRAGSATQFVAVIEAGEPGEGALLALGEDDGLAPRAEDCCPVLGWYDSRTLLLRTASAGSRWIIAWDVQTGQVRRVTELDVDLIALGPRLTR